MPVEGTITVRCACGSKLKAPAGSEGKKARCPACGNIMRLTAGESVPAAAVASSNTMSTATVAKPRSGNTMVARTAASVPPRATVADLGIPAEDDGLGALYELNEQANNAPVVSAGPHCPSCMARLDGNAVICMNCGFDTRSNKALSTVKEAPVLGYATPQKKGRGKGKPVDYMAPQGSFVMGLVLAGVFGVVCSILWIVIMFVTGYEVGILATVVGWTVGLGMQMGQKGYSKQGGVAAATIAGLAIVGPKLLLFALLMAFLPNKDAAKLGVELFHPLTILFVILGIGAAFKTANGASS